MGVKKPWPSSSTLSQKGHLRSLTFISSNISRPLCVLNNLNSQSTFLCRKRGDKLFLIRSQSDTPSTLCRTLFSVDTYSEMRIDI